MCSPRLRPRYHAHVRVQSRLPSGKAGQLSPVFRRKPADAQSILSCWILNVFSMPSYHGHRGARNITTLDGTAEKPAPRLCSACLGATSAATTETAPSTGQGLGKARMRLAVSTDYVAQCSHVRHTLPSFNRRLGLSFHVVPKQLATAVLYTQIPACQELVFYQSYQSHL
jgi:hypothetical protein